MEGEHSDLAPFVNFAVNCIETNSTVTFAENYFGSAVVRTTGSFDSRLSDNFRSGRDQRSEIFVASFVGNFVDKVRDKVRDKDPASRGLQRSVTSNQ